MALIALPIPMPIMPVLPGPYAATTSIGSDGTFTFNGAGDKMAFIFEASSTTMPDQVKFRVSSYTSTGTIEATIETLDASGDPSGTLVTDSATGSVSVSSTGTKTIAGMVGTATLTIGNRYAVVLTAAAGFAGTFTVIRTTGITTGLGLPYSSTKDSAGSWARTPTTNCGYAIGLFTSGGVAIYVAGFAGAYTAALQTYADATNPDERGSAFSVAAPARLIGAVMCAGLGATPSSVNNFDLTLYSDHAGTPDIERTKSFPGAEQSANMFRTLLFASTIDLVANTVYALAAKATSTTGVSLLRHAYATNAELGNYLSTGFYAVTRNNGTGAFTEVNTEAYALFPLISHIDDAASTGGGALIGGRLVR